LAEAEARERVHREGRVADPAEAVVVVALAADPLGQRRGRGRGDRAGRRLDQQLQRERAADDRVAPRAVVALVRPAPPRLLRAAEPLLDLAAQRERDRLL